MSGNTGNTNNARSRTLRVLRVAGPLAVTTFEMFVLAEILWYYLHDGDQTLHDAVTDHWRNLRERARYRRSVAKARDMIRDLPETR